MLKLQFLGTGGAFTNYKDNYHNNAVLWTAKGPMLIDCGTTAVQSLKELGIQPTDVHSVAFTHLHADHASPEMLMWERMYGGADGPQFLKTTFVAPPNVLRPLAQSLKPFMDEYNGRGGVVYNDGVKAMGEWVESTWAQVDNINIRFFKVPHVVGGRVDKAAYGLEITDGDATFLWSGDTVFGRKWVEESYETHTIFHECVFGAKYPGTVHTHYEELLTLPAEVRERMVLMHYTLVPPGIDPVADGFKGAAKRHEVFEVR